MNKKTLITIAVLLLVGVPIVLNFVLKPDLGIPTVGDETHWLAFFGSYLGGIFSCLVAFIAVYQQFRQGVLDMQIRNQEQRIEHLRTDLAKCIGSFNFSQIGAISLFMNETIMYDYIDSELTKLNDAHNKATTQANLWGLIYGQSTETHIEKFNDLYHKCVKAVQDDINAMTDALDELRKTKDYSNFCQKTTCLNKTFNEHQKRFLQPLFDTAQQVINQERETLTKLQSKRKKILS